MRTNEGSVFSSGCNLVACPLSRAARYEEPNNLHLADVALICKMACKFRLCPNLQKMYTILQSRNSKAGPESTKTHPVLVYNIRDDHELSILLPVVDKSHTPDLDVPGERHPVESSEIRP